MRLQAASTTVYGTHACLEVDFWILFQHRMCFFSTAHGLHTLDILEERVGHLVGSGWLASPEATAPPPPSSLCHPGCAQSVHSE